MKVYRNWFIAAAAALFIAHSGVGRSFGQQALSGGVKEQIGAIQALIKETGARWTAGETSLSDLPREEWLKRVGFHIRDLGAPPPEAAAADLPAALDWRDNGGNYVTPVRDQKKCGSCWAFAMTAGLESYVLLTRNTPGADLDLSEQTLLSCSGLGTCGGGGMEGDFLQHTGLPPEAAYPYSAADGACSAAAPGWEASAYRIASWRPIFKRLDAIKAALVKYGPLPTAFVVYEDFMHYRSGIYSYTAGKKLGGHAALLVGYNDAESYFIAKNSWNTGWGEQGFFRIAYSEMNNAVSFGGGTIVYKPSPPAAKPASALSDADAAWRRAEPLFQPLLRWK